jgi:hypothetical protein
MTREEYEKLVKSCASFREMLPEVQARILAAEGEEMERYIAIFQEEQTLMAQAYQNFEKETDQIVLDYMTGVQKEKRQKLVAQESGARRAEENRAEDLLKKL